jgi:murein DD-endopeptidase MepM/ murein hydrolase activator NlpD
MGLFVLLGGVVAAVALATSGTEEPRPTEQAEAKPAPAPIPIDASPKVDPLDTPEPKQWRSAVRRCRKYGNRGYCDGPRRVAKPHGEAAERAERLELGTRRAAGRLLTKSPRPSWVDAAYGAARSTLLWPVEDGRRGRGFGYVRRPGLKSIRHDGVDIPSAPGTPIRAVNDGIVAYSDNEIRGFGNLALIVHPDATVSMYAHLRAIYLFAGQHVRRGQVIGEVGSTGLSMGPHLHFEWRKGGAPRNPSPRFAKVPRKSGGPS